MINKLRPSYKAWVFASMILCGAGLLFYAVRVWTFSHSNDFEVYYRTSQRFLGGHWDQVYTLADLYGLFRYPPVALPMVAWLSWFPFQVARQIWFFINLTSLIWGLVLLYRALAKKNPNQRPWIFTLAWIVGLAILRPTLDSLINSQVDGLMFLGLCLALVGLQDGRATKVGVGIFIPSVLKIGTLILMPVACWRGWKFVVRIGVAMAGVSLVALLWVRWGAGSGPAFAQVIESWWVNIRTLLVSDSRDYVDCIDFRSQALNSAFLRAAFWGWWSVETAHSLWLLSVGLGMGGWLTLAWTQRKTQAWWHAVSLGIVAYLLMMPFTYRRTLLFLAIPLFTLLSRANQQDLTRLQKAALLATVLTISIPGKDVVGEYLFLAIQKGSLPVLAMGLLVAALTQQMLAIKRKRSR